MVEENGATRWPGIKKVGPLGQLREAVQAGEVGVVYVYTADRLSSNLRNWLTLREEFASAGAELRVIWGSSDDVAGDRLPNGTRSGLYGYEHDKVSEV